VNDLTTSEQVTLISIFSFAAPIGLAIGVGVYSTFNPNSQTFILAQGILDSLCAGILLYIGFGLLLKDFGEDMQRVCHGKNKTYKELGMFGGLWLGAGMMAMIGLYL